MEATQLTPHGGAQVGLLGAVEPFAVAVGGGLASGSVAALDLDFFGNSSEYISSGSSLSYPERAHAIGRRHLLAVEASNGGYL